MIVIEGMDNSGKSTLAQKIMEFMAKDRPLTIQESEGPPKGSGEMNARVERYMGMKGTIFVRHPCVSNPLYDLVRPEEERGAIRKDLIEQFYQHRPLFIYCDPLSRGLTNHVEKAHDDPEHIRRITEQYGVLINAYRTWAIYKAQMLYRIGDPIGPLIHRIYRDLCTSI